MSSSTGVFAISVAADMVSMEVQNLRVYERRGLIEPDRTPGGTRLYSPDDVARLIRIRELLAEGLNLAGIAYVLNLESRVTQLQAANRRLRGRLDASRTPPRRERWTCLICPSRLWCSTRHRPVPLGFSAWSCASCC